MIPNLPAYISLIFGLTTLLTLVLFYLVLRNARGENAAAAAGKITAVLVCWLILQAILPLCHLYNNDPHAFPPKIMLLGVLPNIILVVLVFVTKKGRAFADRLPLKHITWVNIVRIPVEMVLYWLFLQRAVPGLMTFAGRNFDILAGITAPIMAWLYFSRRKIGPRMLLYWNILALGLLLNIVVNAILSVPSPLQRFAFDQPNIAINHFPFSWLPTFIVPVVLFGHLVSIRQLIKAGTK